MKKSYLAVGAALAVAFAAGLAIAETDQTALQTDQAPAITAQMKSVGAQATIDSAKMEASALKIQSAETESAPLLEVQYGYYNHHHCHWVCNRWGHHCRWEGRWCHRYGYR